MAKSLKPTARRRWLNPKKHADRGYVMVRVTPDIKWGHDIDLVIADCDRAICLDFSFTSEDQRAQRLKKVDRLTAELERLRASIVDMPACKSD